jgi:hypothetical protein
MFGVHIVRRGSFAQKPWRHVPVLAAVGDDRNRFLVTASDYPKQRRPTFRLKSDPIADPKVEHLRMRAHLVQKPQPRHDPVVQINQFFFREFVDVNFHLHSAFMSWWTTLIVLLPERL